MIKEIKQQKSKIWKKIELIINIKMTEKSSQRNKNENLIQLEHDGKNSSSQY